MSYLTWRIYDIIKHKTDKPGGVSMSTKQITLYALSTCPVCKRTSKLIEEMGLEFTKIEVDLLDSGEQWIVSKEVKKYNPENTYPTLIVSDVIVGFNEDKIRRALIT
jgi:glutaredoxin-like protein NrdH